MTGPRVIDADAVLAALTPREAAGAVAEALRAGLDTTADPPRSVVDVERGQILLMPSHLLGAAGVKIATVAPDNPAAGLPRIRATYVLLDADTLAVAALIDGTALTTLRTAAVSVVGIEPALRRHARPVDVVVFGAGPQAIAHVEAFADCPGITLGDVSLVVRRPERVDDAVASRFRVLAAGSTTVDAKLEAAQLVVCATSARAPLFDSSLLADDVCVVAVGSHEPDARELDSALMSRAEVVVEDVATALRESGDVAMAVADGSLSGRDLVPMASVVRGEHLLDLGRPTVFKSSGMSWQDLVVAQAVVASGSERVG
ncbi:ornithine cyclodeaminase family protein [Nocardioides sp. LHG3406-4]|uniref:ornithine cyclodeaminase family protein n=1 Tax=Nocardioides sp. LHG3406-4 TaxID=2804575 RepID=UPI003CFBB64C